MELNFDNFQKEEINPELEEFLKLEFIPGTELKEYKIDQFDFEWRVDNPNPFTIDLSTYDHLINAVEDYVLLAYGEELIQITLVQNMSCDLEGFYEQYCFFTYSATAETYDRYFNIIRKIDIEIREITSKMIRMTSTSELEKHTDQHVHVQLPFDLDYEEALEYLLRYPNVLQN